jgi:hypothetical protein
VRRFALTLLARREDKIRRQRFEHWYLLAKPILCGTDICATYGLSLGALMSVGLSSPVEPARVLGGLYCDPAIFDLEPERTPGMQCPSVIPPDE